MSNLKYKDLKVVIVTHTYATGPAHDIRDYLNERKTSNLFFINHPLFYNKNINGSGYELYENGLLAKTKKSEIKTQNIISYFIHTIKTLFWVATSGKKWDLFIGSNNLNAFAGIILKKMGLVSKTIYYTIDYDPKRFENKIMNLIYHLIDRICVMNSDVTWNLSPRMADARKKYYNLFGGNQITVPIGIWYDRTPRKGIAEIDKNTLVFMGHILEKSGVQFAIKAIPRIIKKVPSFKFVVIGDGSYLPKLIELTKKNNVEKYVEFTGYIESHKDVENKLSECTIAIALYKKYETDGKINCTYFADPGKIKSYLAAGLPILMTNVPHNAKDIVSHGCGKIIVNNTISISKAVISMLDKKEIEKYKRNTIAYAQKFDWNVILDKYLGEAL